MRGKSTIVRVMGVLAVLLAVNTGVCGQEIDPEPCDSRATAETKELYRWLRNEIWGKKCISGSHPQHGWDQGEAEKIHGLTGIYPKMAIHDFMRFNENIKAYGVEGIKAWQDAGGIVGFMWHWNVAQTPLTYHKNAGAFYLPSSSGDYWTWFRPGYAMVEGTPEHRVFMHDLEQVADLLLEYQEAGIPVVWRPYHEAAGNSANTGNGDGAWFWWGTDGPGAYIRLWRYTHDYLQSRGIHNLIYVWTSQLNDHTWYPGDEYVDIVARDNYDEDSADHNSRVSDFHTLRILFPNKMLALAECSYLPSAESMVRDNAIWLYAAPWAGESYVPQNNSAEFLREFLSDPAVVSR